MKVDFMLKDIKMYEAMFSSVSALIICDYLSRVIILV